MTSWQIDHDSLIGITLAAQAGRYFRTLVRICLNPRGETRRMRKPWRCVSLTGGPTVVRCEWA